MSEKKQPINDGDWILSWLVAIAVIFCLVVFNISYASGPDIEQEVSVKNVVSGDTSKSFGVGGADYDIGRGSCRYHWGGLTFVFPARDKFCEGLDLINAGLVSAGTRHICKQSKVRLNYDTFDECQTDMALIMSHQPPPPPVADDDDEDYQPYIEQLQAQQMQIDELEQLVQKAPVRAKTIVQNTEFLNDNKRAKLEELRGKN